MGSSFYRGADACILVYDTTSALSLSNLAMWKSEFLLQIDFNYREDLPFVVVGTKADLTQSRAVPTESAKEWCNNNSIPDRVVVRGAFYSVAAIRNERKDGRGGGGGGDGRGGRGSAPLVPESRVGFNSSIHSRYAPGVIDIKDFHEKKSFCCC